MAVRADLERNRLVVDGEVPAAEQAIDGEMARQQRLQMLGGDLQREFDERVNDRRQVENRWFEDLRQYNGLYDSEVLEAIKETEGSELFVNITRSKTDGVEARIIDLMLPTDDRNWDIKPTPMPELGDLQSSTLAYDKTPEGNPIQVSDLAIATRDVAAKRCMKMRDTIDDQLSEANYNAVIRDVVHDGCVLGIGILKGPVNKNRMRKAWQTQRDESGNSVQVQQVRPDRRPWVNRVDPWNFYPETGIINIEDSESEFERHFLTRKQVRDLAKQPGFLKEKIEDILKEARRAPNVTVDHRVQLRAMAGETSGRDERYELIEYTGPVEVEDLIAAGVDVDVNPLKAHPGNVWFMNSVVVKADVQTMESLEKVYHVWNWGKDDSTIFGNGVPRRMRASQKMANSSIRMIYDNAGLAVGGQLIYAPTAVTPADGNPRMTPRKTWYLTDAAVDAKSVMWIFETKLHLEWLIPLFQLAMRLADEESSLPLIAQGDQASHITKTKGGMSMLMDAAGVMLRRSVKGADDGLTVPFISGMYDWNMEFNPDQEIKGDFNVQARGSSALMEREKQTEQFMLFMQFLQSNPLFAKVVEWDKVLEEGTRLLRVNRNLLKPAEEIEQIIADLEKNPPEAPKDPRIAVAEIKDGTEKIRIKTDVELEGARLKLEEAMHDKDVQAAMQKIATEANLSMEELTNALGVKRMDIDNENQRFNAEMVAKAAFGTGI